ncbi:hypothetical protein HanPSC8_Chr12g0543511 [Helianthus annuus]|nr:hypothetical protein HanPSC8_Chr12g0543511 [Helianthus annuus]
MPLGERWSLQRNEPWWVVGEHKQLFFETLPCLARPPPPDGGDVT